VEVDSKEQLSDSDSSTSDKLPHCTGGIQTSISRLETMLPICV
jgi:hypothetical protein